MRNSAPNTSASLRRSSRHALAPSRLARALAAASLLSVGLPLVNAAPPALPAGLSVAAGQAQVNVNGSQMTVTNSAQAILNWSSFSIGQGAAVFFQQPNAASKVLNRVTGSDPSSILGSLGSNGQVWLLNPNGVLFGASARVDVGGLVASTLRINDLDWTAGRFRLANGALDDRSASVSNRGEIRTTQGGTLALIAGTVGNEGLMHAPGGHVVLAAGQTVELVDTGTANLSVRVTAPSGSARNLGVLEAAGGRIDITAAAVNQDGIVRADSLGRGQGGEIWIKASDNISLAPGSLSSANGGSGGRVVLQADSGRTTVQGTVSVRGTAGGGGEAVVLGPEIGLLAGSRIDASGATAGGEVYVGGGAGGNDPRFVNARALYVDPLASINADAKALGDGGKILLWSDTATRAYGSFSARGGAAGGNGGFIETSGGWLDARPSAIDTLAPLGRPGEWLLDPYNILISDAAVGTLGTGPVFTAGASGSSINSLTISAALANGNNVSISTGGANGGTEAGNIRLENANIDVAVFVSGRPGGLTLIADGGISMVNSSITSSIGAMPVTFLAAQSGPGEINLLNSTISTGIGNSHGDILLTGGAGGLTPSGTSFSGAGGAVSAGVSLVNSRLDAASARVTLQGVSRLAEGSGVSVNSASSVAAGALAITGDGATGRGLELSGSLNSRNTISLLGSGGDIGILMSNASVNAGGRVDIRAPSVTLSSGTRIASTAAGDAILIANGVGPLVSFANNAGPQALSVTGANGSPPSGRWIVYATDIKDAARFEPGGLLPTFRRYGAGNNAWAADTGNGLVFSTNELATVSGRANTRVYDATTTATLATVNVSTSVAGDVATLINSGASFATKNVGQGIAVGLDAPQPISALSADGAAVFGYTVVSTLSGDITPATLTLSGLAAANKVYDATTAARLIGTASVTPLGTDAVSVGGLAVASFADKNVGTAKPVSVSGLTLSGADAGNYILAPLSSLSADITRASLALSGLTAASKIYDTTTAANLTGTATITPLGNDDVALGGQAIASFADKNVGVAKPVLVGGLSLTGADASNYFPAPVSNLTADITPATLIVTGLSAANKVYDATTAAALSGTATVAPLGNDLASLGGQAVGSFADKNVGTDKPVFISGLALSGADAGNYVLAPSPGLNADITPATLNVAGLAAANKVYDATTVARLSGTATVAPLGNDRVSLGGQVVASFADKNVGTAKPVAISGLSLSGADAGNYILAPLPSLSADITRASLVLSGLTVASKVYDTTTAATLTGTATITPLGGDSVVLGGQAVASFADRNAGTAKQVFVGGLSLSGADAGNYFPAPVSNLTADITPASLTVSGLSAADKVYDATTAAQLRGTATVAPLGTDLVTISGQAVGSFADKNVGTAKPVILSGLALSGADAGNYILAPLPSLSGNVTPATLSLSGLSAANKVYDATIAAPLNGTAAVAPLANDLVTLSGQAAGSFADKNVGVAKPVFVIGLALSGPDAGNYILAPLPSLSADITRATLSVSGLTAANKIYDATTAATLRGVAAIAPLSNDVVTLSGQAVGSFDDKNVGAAKPVAVSGLTLSGADAGNYVLAPLPRLSADVTRATLSVAGLSAAHKVYDATAIAPLSGTASVAPLGSDQVTLSGQAIGSFADKNAGAAKPIAVSGLSLVGADAGNYTLAPLSALSADITRSTLTMSGLSAVPKVYDATTAATLSGTAAVTPMGNDQVSLSGRAVGSFADKNVGAAKPVAVSGLALTGADAGNYILASPSGLSADITPATLVLAGLSAGNKIYDGSNAAPLTGTGTVSAARGDVLTLVGTPTASFENANVGIGKAVTVSGLTLAGPDALNYRLVPPMGLTGNVDPAVLTYIAQSTVRSIGTPLADLQGRVAGFVGNDTLASATQGTAVFRATAEVLAAPGTYAIFGSGLTASNYRFVQAPGNLQALSIVGLSEPALVSLGSTRNLQSIPLIEAPSPRNTGGLVNLLSSPSFDASSAPNGNFGSALLGALSPTGLTQLLSGRDRFKEQLLADARARLERDPALANLRPCPSLEEAQQGKCLINETLKIRAEEQRTLLAAAQARQAELPDIATGSLDNLPPTAAGQPATPTAPEVAPVLAPRDVPAATPIAPVGTSATSAPTPQPERLALAAPTLRQRVLPGIDPLQAQLDLLLSNYRVKTAVLPQIERKIAIVVGVDNYADTAIPSLGNAVRDAKAVARMFESRLGYETIVLENATRAMLVGALNRLALTMAKKDSVVIYYAGHGELIEATGQGYWLLSDSSAQDPGTWLSNSDINRLVGQIGAHQVALVSDSCYSGTLITGDRIRAKSLAPDPQDVLSRKTVVVMTSGGNEPVFDQGRDGHSLFAWNLLNVLGKVDQWQPGGNLFERIRFEVARALPQRPQYSSSRAGGSQPGGDFLYEYRQLEAQK